MEKDIEKISDILKSNFNPDLPETLNTFGDLFALFYHTPNVDAFLTGALKTTPLPDKITIKREDIGGQPVFVVMENGTGGLCFRYVKR